jgi:hypothetical protein
VPLTFLPPGAQPQADLSAVLSASDDLAAAHDWYEQRSPGLGKDFVRKVDAAVAGTRATLAWPRRREKRRAIVPATCAPAVR